MTKRSNSKQSAVLGALWKLPLGLLLLAVEANALWDAFAGNGWFQLSSQAIGYWLFWAFIVWLAFFLIYRGVRPFFGVNEAEKKE